MTTETITFGYVLIAASVLILVGAFIGWGGKDWWDERTARKAVRIVSTKADSDWAAIARVINDEESRVLHAVDALAKVERQRLRSVPMQRNGGAS